MGVSANFDCFLNPASVAVIGASNSMGSWGYMIMAGLTMLYTGGPQGSVFSVEIFERLIRDYIDYLAVRFDYEDDTSHNMWRSFRTRRRTCLDTNFFHTYEKAGRYDVLVGVSDIPGSDTRRFLEVTV